MLITVLKWYEDIKLAVTFKKDKPSKEEIENIKKYYGKGRGNFVQISNLETYLEQLEIRIVNKKPEILMDYIEDEAKLLHEFINKGYISVIRTPDGFAVVDFKHGKYI